MYLLFRFTSVASDSTELAEPVASVYSPALERQAHPTLGLQIPEPKWKIIFNINQRWFVVIQLTLIRF